MKLFSEKLKILKSFLFAYKKQLKFLVFIGAFSALLDSSILIGLFDFTRFVINQNFLQSHFLKQVLDSLGLSSFSFLTLALLYACVIGFLAIMRFYTNIVFEKNSCTLRSQALVNLQEKMMHLYLSLPWHHFLKKKQGDMMFHLTSLPSKCSEILLYVSKIFLTTIVFIVICGVLLLTSKSLFLVGAVLGFIYFLFIQRFEKKISYRVSKERVDSSRLQSTVASEALSGMRYIRSYGYEDMWFKRFSFEVHRFANLMKKDDFWIVLPPKLLELFIILGLLSFVSLFLSFTNQNFIGAIPMLCIYFFGLIRLMPSIVQLGNAYVQLQRNFPYVEFLHELIKEYEVKLHIPKNVYLKLQKPIRISLESVCFSYEPGQPVLDNLSLEIKEGKVTALVGASGNGKSTILDLILGFIKPEKGEILVNGVSLADIDLEAWRSHVAYVGQDVFLFHDTIGANLKMGLPGASLKDLEDATRISGILEFIKNLPEKWNTIVGDRGIKLSGGQRQRLALARALLRNPDIYLLDEPTSALDIETEQAIMSPFLDYVRSKTVLLIAHRLETIKCVDCIVTLEKRQVTVCDHEVVNAISK